MINDVSGKFYQPGSFLPIVWHKLKNNNKSTELMNLKIPHCFQALSTLLSSILSFQKYFYQWRISGFMSRPRFFPLPFSQIASLANVPWQSLTGVYWLAGEVKLCHGPLYQWHRDTVFWVSGSQPISVKSLQPGQTWPECDWAKLMETLAKTSQWPIR